MLTYRINKALRNFEEYPNDIARGFNLPSMPIYYQFDGEKNYSEVLSNSILIQTPEPDFSMPFNVNAITNMLFGITFVNTLFALFKDREDDEVEEEIKGKEKSD